MTRSSKIFNGDKYHSEENVCPGAGLSATSKNSLGVCVGIFVLGSD